MIAEIVSLILELLVTMFKIQILEREDQVGEGQDKGQLEADRYSEDLGEATSQETLNQGILSGAKMQAAQLGGKGCKSFKTPAQATNPSACRRCQRITQFLGASQ